MTWEIEPQDDGTCLLTVVHDRLEGAPKTAASVASGGWMHVLSGLKTLLETGDPLFDYDDGGRDDVQPPRCRPCRFTSSSSRRPRRLSGTRSRGPSSPSATSTAMRIEATPGGRRRVRERRRLGRRPGHRVRTRRGSSCTAGMRNGMTRCGPSPTEPGRMGARAAGRRHDAAHLVHDELERSPKTATGVAGPGWMRVLSGLKTLLETGTPLIDYSKGEE